MSALSKTQDGEFLKRFPLPSPANFPSCDQKCDGVRPVCGQCTSKNRPDDCEYTTGQGLTRSQMLEENIALLESRIKELENPDTTAPSVKLHAVSQPHSHGSVARSAGGSDDEGALVAGPAPGEYNLLLSFEGMPAYRILRR